MDSNELIRICLVFVFTQIYPIQHLYSMNDACNGIHDRGLWGDFWRFQEISEDFRKNNYPNNQPDDGSGHLSEVEKKRFTAITWFLTYKALFQCFCVCFFQTEVRHLKPHLNSNTNKLLQNEHQKSTLEMVQQQSVDRILHDLSPTWSASALVAQLQLENLQFWRTSDKVCMMDKIMNCQRKPWRKCAQAQKLQLQEAQIATPSLSLQNRHVPVFILPIGDPTLELCPHKCAISCDSTGLQNCTDGLDGRRCLIAIRINDFFFFYPI